MEDKKVRRLAVAGVLCAVVVIATVFAAVPIPGVQGAYANAGDAVVYVAAYMLGGWTGAAVAALGSAAADLILGSTLYAPASFAIKGVMALIAGRLFMKKKGYTLTMLLCGAVMTAGYFAFECIIFGSAAAVISIPANLVQAAAGALLGGIAVRGLENMGQ